MTLFPQEKVITKLMHSLARTAEAANKLQKQLTETKKKKTNQ